MHQLILKAQELILKARQLILKALKARAQKI
jgi:hypothetical protein